MKTLPLLTTCIRTGIAAASLAVVLGAASPLVTAASPEAHAKPDPTQPSVDINTATEESLQQDLGLGPDDARAIIRHRQQKGPLSTPAELKSVRGLSAGTAAKLKGKIMFSSSSTTGEPDTVTP